MAAHSSVPAWRFHGQRSWMGYSPWDPRELDSTKRLTHTQTIVWSLGSIQTQKEAIEEISVKDLHC